MKIRPIDIVVVKILAAIFVAVLLVAVAVKYSSYYSSRQDEVKFDLILSTQRVDKVERIEGISVIKTNSIAAKDVQLFLASLARTNRIREFVYTKDQGLFSIRATSGTNEVFLIHLLESGIWDFYGYSFRLKAEPIYSLAE